MNSFLHTYLSPFVYYDYFGWFGAVLVCALIYTAISSFKLKGKLKYISWVIQIGYISLFFVHYALPIDLKDQKDLNDQMQAFSSVTIEEPTLKVERLHILQEYANMSDKGYINTLEEIYAYSMLGKFSMHTLETLKKQEIHAADKP